MTYSSYFKNKKTGNIYRQVAIAANATNGREGEKMIIYEAAGDKSLIGQLFVRESKEFFEKFEPFELK